MTEAERLAKMEAILERVEVQVGRIETKVDNDVADLAAIKNRGIGILVGVSLAAGAIGANAAAFWKWMLSVVH